MFTAGFAETGEEEGAALAEKLREIAARGKLNIVGPNCMGIYSPRGRISPWGSLPTEVGPDRDDHAERRPRQRVRASWRPTTTCA